MPLVRLDPRRRQVAMYADRSRAAVKKRDVRALQSLSFLQGKTVLLLGDSVDRQQIDYLCQHTFSDATLDVVRLHQSPHDLQRLPSSENSQKAKVFSEPHVCTLPKELFPESTSFWNLMLYGVMAEEHEWDHKGDYIARPAHWLPKLRLMAEAMNKAGRKPDLVVVHSG